MTCRIRSLQPEDLPTVLTWRNDPAIRRFMRSQELISPEAHQRWYQQAICDPARRLLIAEDASAAIGFVQFANVEDDGVAEWGFYAAPGAPKGSGRQLGTSALRHAFDHLHLHKVAGQSLASNAASIRCHESLGFQREGCLRQQWRIAGVYHDLVCFGILRTEWSLNHV